MCKKTERAASAPTNVTMSRQDLSRRAFSSETDMPAALHGTQVPPGGTLVQTKGTQVPPEGTLVPPKPKVGEHPGSRDQVPPHRVPPEGTPDWHQGHTPGPATGSRLPRYRRSTLVWHPQPPQKKKTWLLLESWEP